MKNFLKKIVVKALEWEARVALVRHKPQIVAVTGSVGKTSTKDAVYAVFAGTFHTRKSEKSFNSEIGVPLTILGCKNGWNNPFLWATNLVYGFHVAFFSRTSRYPRWLVLEVGADRPGDIQSITRWLKPDVAIITRIGPMPVHIEFFPSRERLVEEKAALAKAVKEGGTLVLNNDDEDVASFKKYAKGGAKIITVGVEQQSAIMASHQSVFYTKSDASGSETDEKSREMPAGVTFKVNFENNSVPVMRNGVLGDQHIFPTLQAIAAGVSQGLTIVAMSQALADLSAAPGRMRLVQGLKGSVIIDDTYNASPIALHEALKTLGGITVSGEGATRGRKIAVIGDMMELGRHSSEAHEKAGLEAAKIVDLLVTVGVRTRAMSQGALDGGMADSVVEEFDRAEEAGDYLRDVVRAGDILLVKGSQSLRMERAVKAVMAHPEDAELLLVRQDEEWQRR